MFQLQHVSDEREFTAWDLCESFAKKKNFMVNRKRYPDAYRGANFLLRMAVSGQIVLAFEPPGFLASDFENEKGEIFKLLEVTHLSNRKVFVKNRSQMTESREFKNIHAGFG